MKSRSIFQNKEVEQIEKKALPETGKLHEDFIYHLTALPSNRDSTQPLLSCF